MNPSRSFSISLIVLGFVICSLPVLSFGMLQNQESGTSLTELLQQWQTLEGKIAAKKAELKPTTSEPNEPPVAEAQDREKLLAEYNELLTQAEALFLKIETQAKAQLVATPNDSQATRTLLGLMLNDAQFGRDARVFQLGDTLISQGINPEYFVMASRSERLSIPARELFDELLT